MSQYFPKPYKSFGGNINVKVHLSNYASKTDLKNVLFLNQYFLYFFYNLNNKFSCFIMIAIFFYQHTSRPLVLLSDFT